MPIATFFGLKIGSGKPRIVRSTPPPPLPIFFLLACSRRSDSRAQEKNSRRKKNRRATRGGKGQRTRSLVLALPPPSVFPVYKLTRSPFTAALYDLNAWNRLSFHWRQSTKKVVKNFLTTVWRRIQSRKNTIHLEKCPSLRSWIRKTPNTKKTTPPPHVRHKECGRSDLRKTYKAKTVDAIKNFWTQSRLVCSRDLREYKTVTNWQSPFPSDVY